MGNKLTVFQGERQGDEIRFVVLDGNLGIERSSDADGVRTTALTELEHSLVAGVVHSVRLWGSDRVGGTLQHKVRGSRSLSLSLSKGAPGCPDCFSLVSPEILAEIMNLALAWFPVHRVFGAREKAEASLLLALWKSELIFVCPQSNTGGR